MINQNAAPIHPQAYQMGNLRGEYKFGAKVLLVSGILMILVGGFIAYAMLQSSGAKGALAVPGFFLLLGVVMLVIWYLRRDSRVQVFDQGLLYARGAKVYAWRWEEIAFVWQHIVRVRVNGIPAGTRYTYTLQHRSGEKLKLTDAIRGIKELGETIQSETFTRLMPLAVAAYNNGQPLNFGKLTIGQQGIGNSKEIVPWAQVKGVEVNQGYVAVKREGKWLRWANVPVAGVPNFFIFMALVDQIIGVKR